MRKDLYKKIKPSVFVFIAVNMTKVNKIIILLKKTRIDCALTVF